MKPATAKLLEKASRSIGAAERELGDGNVDFAASRAYYAGGVHAAFAEQFVKTRQMDPKFHSWLVDAFDERIQGDYDAESEVDAEAVSTTIQQAREFLQTAQRYLASHA